MKNILSSLLKKAVLPLGLLMMASISFADLNTTITYTDGANFGFNDPTLGADRRAAFEYAVDIWASALSGSINVEIEAGWANLGGSGTEAVLGSAGPTFFSFNSTTAFAAPLANQISGSDLAPLSAEVAATFNADVDNSTVLGPTDFYYGLDEESGSDVNFVRVALHELGHGMGFLDTIDENTGEFTVGKDNPTPGTAGRPDTYSQNLAEGTTPLDTMTDGQRLAAITNENLFFTGSNTATEHGSNPPIFAPSTFQPGSSVSHFKFEAFTPSELMEPVLDGPSLHPGLTEEALADIQWPGVDLNQPAIDLGNASSSSVAEGSSVTFDILLSAAPSDSATVNLKSSGTAQLGTDFSLTPAPPYSFTSSDSTITVTLEALTDGTSETTESADLSIEAPVGALFPATAGTPSLSFLVTNVSSVDEWSLY